MNQAGDRPVAPDAFIRVHSAPSQNGASNTKPHETCMKGSSRHGSVVGTAVMLYCSVNRWTLPLRSREK